jgi:GNAT superfamily N-acetyltransferase
MEKPPKNQQADIENLTEGLTVVVEKNPTAQHVAYIKQKIVEFNSQHFELSLRVPLVIHLKNEVEIVAGVTGQTFGNWLMIDYLWVSESMRGKGLGLQLLKRAEKEAKVRHCTDVMLDTLAFQAKPFYEKQGYKTVFEMQDYPLTGSRYYMTKEL